MTECMSKKVIITNNHLKEKVAFMHIVNCVIAFRSN